MARQVNVGKQSFADMREHGDFLVDKTSFVRDWWGARDEVTLVCRPRRFGKTLALSMVECFFSQDFA
ncbi:MAG: AAA family ATPase [Eggerthellaceae bacterium]|nr:AAA family ATPase [Eggerthellaceae bacterium]